VTESADGPGAGHIQLQTSVDYARDVRFPLSGLEGNLSRIGLIRLDFGLSAIAEFDLSGGIRDHLAITSRTPAVLSDLLRLSNPTATGAFDDVVVGTKIRLVPQGAQPALAVRVATRLPNAKHASGLGQNTTDFYATVIVDRSVGPFHAVGNVGYGILGDPLVSHRSVGSFLYAGELQEHVASTLSIVERVEGRTGPAEPGLESRSIARAGVVWARALVRLELDGTFGLTDRDGGPGLAVAAGFTFHAFTTRP
jgi:hypothetical protein